METLVLALDLIGTFVFALSGAMAAVRHRLDIFGVLVLAFTAGTAALIGIAAAWFAACVGGRHRDGVPPSMAWGWTGPRVRART